MLTLVLNLILLTNPNHLDYRVISGSVIDENGPRIGEIIVVKGTTHGVVTDVNGEFCLIAPLIETVFLVLPGCFDELVIRSDQGMNSLKINLGKVERIPRNIKRISETNIEDFHRMDKAYKERLVTFYSKNENNTIEC